MSFFTRALRAIRYYKRNTLLLFIIFSILFALVLGAMAIGVTGVNPITDFREVPSSRG